MSAQQTPYTKDTRKEYFDDVFINYNRVEQEPMWEHGYNVLTQDAWYYLDGVQEAAWESWYMND